MAKKKEDPYELKGVSIQDVQKAFNYQRENLDWNFYSERELVESLMYQRFNFLIAAFSIFIAAAASVKTQFHFILIFGIGSIIVLLLSFTIYRAYLRLFVLLKILYKLGENHVLPIVHKEVESLKTVKLWNVNPIIGIVVPIFCSAIMILGLVLSIFKILVPSQ